MANHNIYLYIFVISFVFIYTAGGCSTETVDGYLWNSTDTEITLPCQSPYITGMALRKCVNGSWLDPVFSDCVKARVTDRDTIYLIQYVCCGTAIFCIFLTFLIFLFYWREPGGAISAIVFSFGLSIIGSETTFLAGVNNTTDELSCKITAVWLHYLPTVAVFHTFTVIFYLATLRFQTSKYSYCCLLLAAWVIPGIIVGLYAYFTMLKEYGSSEHCWILLGTNLFWVYYGTIMSIVLVIFVSVFFIIYRFRLPVRGPKRASNIGAIPVFIIFITTVMTWVTGVISVNEYQDSAFASQIIFGVLNVLQGIAFLIIFGIMGTRPRKEKARGLGYSHPRTSVPTISTFADFNDNKVQSWKYDQYLSGGSEPVDFYSPDEEVQQRYIEQKRKEREFELTKNDDIADLTEFNDRPSRSSRVRSGSPFYDPSGNSESRHFTTRVEVEQTISQHQTNISRDDIGNENDTGSENIASRRRTEPDDADVFHYEVGHDRPKDGNPAHTDIVDDEKCIVAVSQPIVKNYSQDTMNPDPPAPSRISVDHEPFTMDVSEQQTANDQNFEGFNPYDGENTEKIDVMNEMGEGEEYIQSATNKLSYPAQNNLTLVAADIQATSDYYHDNQHEDFQYDPSKERNDQLNENSLELDNYRNVRSSGENDQRTEIPSESESQTGSMIIYQEEEGNTLQHIVQGLENENQTSKSITEQGSARNSTDYSYYIQSTDPPEPRNELEMVENSQYKKESENLDLSKLRQQLKTHKYTEDRKKSSDLNLSSSFLSRLRQNLKPVTQFPDPKTIPPVAPVPDYEIDDSKSGTKRSRSRQREEVSTEGRPPTPPPPFIPPPLAPPPPPLPRTPTNKRVSFYNHDVHIS